MPYTTTYIPTDIDECITATHNCHGVAHCYNNQGSFTCECRESYTGDGLLCDPVGKLKKLLFFKYSKVLSVTPLVHMKESTNHLTWARHSLLHLKPIVMTLVII